MRQVASSVTGSSLDGCITAMDNGRVQVRQCNSLQSLEALHLRLSWLQAFQLLVPKIDQTAHNNFPDGAYQQNTLPATC